MDTSNSTQTSNSRLRIGTRVLNAAQVVDTKLVSARLSAFSEAQGKLADAQRKVEQTEEWFEAAKVRLSQVDADCDEAVEVLACELIRDREPRGNPFANLVAESPSAIKVMPPADEVRAVRELVTAVEHRKGLSRATIEAAKRAADAAEKLEAAAGPVEALRAQLDAARQMREVIAREWKQALGGLRRGARAAADEGAPNLYAALFETDASSPKRTKPVPQPAEQPTPVTQAASTAATA